VLSVRPARLRRFLGPSSTWRGVRLHTMCPTERANLPSALQASGSPVPPRPKSCRELMQTPIHRTPFRLDPPHRLSARYIFSWTAEGRCSPLVAVGLPCRNCAKRRSRQSVLRFSFAPCT